MTGNSIILRVIKDSLTYDLQVDSNVPLRLDMSTLESQEIGKLFSVGSQTFNIAGTKDSNKFFEFAFNPGTDDSVAMYNTLPVSVLLNGDVVLEGQIQLLEAISSEDGYVSYTVQVIDTPITLESQLQSKLIKDANWSAYDHVLTSQSIVDSWSDNLLSGSVYYPVAHYGFPDGESASYAAIALGNSQSSDGTISNPLTPMQLQQFLPAVKVKDTLDVIFDQAGFRYTGSFTETNDFNQLYILNKPNEGLGPVVSGSTEATFTALTDFAAIQSYTIQTSSAQYRRVPYITEQLDPSNAYTPVCNRTSPASNGSKYTAQATGEHTFNCNLSAFNPTFGTAATATIKISLMKGSLPCGGTGGGSGTQVATDEISLSNTYGLATFNLSIDTTTTVTQGDDVWVWVEYYRTAGTGGSNLDVGYFTNKFECTSAPDDIDGATIDMSLQWNPQTKSIDLLKGIIQQFNLVLLPTVNNRSTIEVYQFDEWLREGEIKDWTNKYDTAKRIGVSHTIEDLEASILLQNAEDEDRFSKQTKDNDPNFQYGTLRLIADNNISQGEKTVGDYFAPVILGGSTGVNPLDNETPSTRINLNTTFIYPHLYKFDNTKLTSFSCKPRIGYKVNNPLPTNSAFYIGFPFNELEVTGSYGTISNVADLPVTSSVSNDLHFNNTYTTFTNNPTLNLNNGVNNYTNYYETYFDSLYWEGSKKLTIDLYFDPSEYKDIKLNDRVQIKGQTYRINRIVGFNLTSRDVVTVELIKLYPEYWQL